MDNFNRSRIQSTVALVKYDRRFPATGTPRVEMKGTPMTTISKDNKVVTLIIIFTVEPKNQQRLVDMLVVATEETMRHMPGFVAANIHKSLDGERVANYASGAVGKISRRF